MRITPFAGLTALEPGEPFSTDGFSFQDRNPELVDRLLRVGAVSHRHDEHAALGNPTAEALIGPDTASGSIPAGVTAAFTYTWIDQWGGETMPAPIVDVATPDKLPSPGPPSGSADYAAGALLAGSYSYVKTWVDGSGGETLASLPRIINIDPGHASGRSRFTNLNSGMSAVGAAGWRLYKSQNGGSYHYIASGTGSTLDDAGQLCADCVSRPPTTNTSGDHNSLLFIMPQLIGEPTPSGAVAFRVYGSIGVGFDSPSLFGQWPAASASGNYFGFQNWNPGPGRPPSVSTTIPGAAKINAETELTNFHAGGWKESVAASANLPSGAVGDVRLVRTASALYGVLGASASGAGGWSMLTASGAGGGGGGGSVQAWQVVASGDFNTYAQSITNSSYNTTWNDTGRSVPSVAYYKDPNGVVHLRGGVEFYGMGAYTLSAPYKMFTLASGYRPDSERRFEVGYLEHRGTGGTYDFINAWWRVSLEVRTNGEVWVGYIMEPRFRFDGTNWIGGIPSLEVNDQLSLEGLSFRAA